MIEYNEMWDELTAVGYRLMMERERRDALYSYWLSDSSLIELSARSKGDRMTLKFIDSLDILPGDHKPGEE